MLGAWSMPLEVSTIESIGLRRISLTPDARKDESDLAN
jgi:hypothetical protein